VKITGCKKKTYVFDDVRQRENFCQMVQQLKNMYSLNADVRQISIYVGTWNLGKQLFIFFLFHMSKNHSFFAMIVSHFGCVLNGK